MNRTHPFRTAVVCTVLSSCATAFLCVVATWLGFGHHLWLAEPPSSKETAVFLGYKPTIEGEACFAATEWARHIEKLRHEQDWHSEADQTGPGDVVSNRWHDVRDRLSVYAPSPDLIEYLYPSDDSVLAERGPVEFAANLISGGPTCVRVSTIDDVITANCVSKQGESYNSWALCPNFRQ